MKRLKIITLGSVSRCSSEVKQKKDIMKYIVRNPGKIKASKRKTNKCKRKYFFYFFKIVFYLLNIFLNFIY